MTAAKEATTEGQRLVRACRERAEVLLDVFQEAGWSHEDIVRVPNWPDLDDFSFRASKWVDIGRPLHHHVEVYVNAGSGLIDLRGVPPSQRAARRVLEAAGLSKWLGWVEP
jgi:hypothetical protein